MKLPERCVDMTADHVVQALKSTPSMGALLRHMARIARPGEGAPKILVPIARMASSACDWVDGGLHVELTREDTKTRIVVAIDLGGGMRELMYPRLFLDVDPREFVRAVKLAPQLVAPMEVSTNKDGLVLTCAEEVVGTIAPPLFEISEQSLRRSLSPALRRSLPPIGGPTSLSVEMPFVDPAALAGLVPKAPRVPVVEEMSELDLGWDVAASSPPRSAPPSAPSIRKLVGATNDARRSKAPPARASMAPAAKAAPRPPGQTNQRPWTPGSPAVRGKRPTLRRVPKPPAGAS